MQLIDLLEEVEEFGFTLLTAGTNMFFDYHVKTDNFDKSKSDEYWLKRIEKTNMKEDDFVVYHYDEKDSQRLIMVLFVENILDDENGAEAEAKAWMMKKTLAGNVVR